jgi:hypothetical protein
MGFKKVLDSFFEGAKVLFRKPIIILSGLILWLILQGISIIGKFLAPNFQTTISNVVWTIAVAFVSFVIGGYFLAGMIGVSKNLKEKEEENEKTNKFFTNANKFWLRSFFIILFILLVSLVIGRIAHYGAFYIGKAANLATTKAIVVFVLIYLIGLLGILVFFTYANFLLVIKNLKIHQAIKGSVKLVKKNYFATLFLSVVFFGLFLLLDWIKSVIGDVLLFGLFLPYFVTVLTVFVETVDLKK